MLRAAANEIERQQKDLIHLNRGELIYEQVIDEMESKQKQKLQSEMGSMRARIAALNGEIGKLTETLYVKELENKYLKATLEELQSDLSKLRDAAGTDQTEIDLSEVWNSGNLL